MYPTVVVLHLQPVLVKGHRALGRPNLKAPVCTFISMALELMVQSRTFHADRIIGSSAYSNTTSGFQMTSGFNISPNRASNSSQMGATSHPFDFTSAGSSSGTPASPSLARTSNGATLPFLNQNHHHHPNRESQNSSDFPTDSRRSSLGSQVNSGLNSLHINNTGSPYSGSVNHSATSLAQNLSRERGIPNNTGARNSRSSGQLPVSPLSPNGGEPRPIGFAPRIAPPIGRNPRSDIYNADEPIQGQAYAFPDPPTVQPGDLPPTPSHRTRDLAAIDEYGSTVFSRRDSGHTSITSSILTSDSRLPPGQRRLDEGVRLDGRRLTAWFEQEIHMQK